MVRVGAEMLCNVVGMWHSEIWVWLLMPALICQPETGVAVVPAQYVTATASRHFGP